MSEPCSNPYCGSKHLDDSACWDTRDNPMTDDLTAARERHQPWVSSHPCDPSTCDAARFRDALDDSEAAHLSTEKALHAVRGELDEEVRMRVVAQAQRDEARESIDGNQAIGYREGYRAARALADELAAALIDENAAACNEFCSGEHSQQCLNARAALAKREASK